MILPAQHLAALVELAAVHAHILVFRSLSHQYELPSGQVYVVHPAQRGQEHDDYRRRRGQTADGQVTLEHARHAESEFALLSQFPRRTAQMIRPIALSGFGYGVNVKLRASPESLPSVVRRCRNA